MKEIIRRSSPIDEIKRIYKNDHFLADRSGRAEQRAVSKAPHVAE